MPDVKRTVKLVTEQRIIDEPSDVGEIPMRLWNIEVYILNEDGKAIPANVYEKATYKLHGSFGKRATQIIKKSPFRIEEKGWGEFDLQVVLTTSQKGIEHTLKHDLNFNNPKYENTHIVTFRNPKPDLVALLRESGPVGDENGVRGASRREDPAKKKGGRKDKNVEMENLAEGLQKLGEDDLLHVVQLVHDNKTPETYTKNDMEKGEFHVDLYTLPDALVKMLWDFTSSRVDM